MQFFNFTLRFGQVSWDLKVPLRISEERETPYQKPLSKTPPFRLRATRLDLSFSTKTSNPVATGPRPTVLTENPQG